MSRVAAPSLVLMVLVAAPAAAQSLAPHEATYHLTIRGGAGGQQLSGGGKATVKVERTCTAWRLFTVMTMSFAAGGQKLSMTLRLAAVESLDGLTYESRTRVVAGKMREEIKVVAKRTADGVGTATVTKNTGRRTVHLPKGTIFPLSHVRRTLVDIAKGQTSRSSLVFDHESSGQVMLVSDKVASAPVPPLSAIAAPLRVDKAYRVQSQAFSRRDSSGGGRPGLDEIVLGNGVTLIMRAKVGGLSLSGKLVSAKPLKPETCKTN